MQLSCHLTMSASSAEYKTLCFCKTPQPSAAELANFKLHTLELAKICTNCHVLIARRSHVKCQVKRVVQVELSTVLVIHVENIKKE